MAYGFGWRGRGGFGFGRGRGFGFRGSSPPWPYAGRGRGGLPRGAYYWEQSPVGYARVQHPAYTRSGVGSSYRDSTGASFDAPQMTRQEELDFLRDRAEMLNQELDDIDAGTRGLETNK